MSLRSSIVERQPIPSPAAQDLRFVPFTVEMAVDCPSVGIVNLELNENMEFARPSQFFRLALSALHVLGAAASAAFKSRATLHLENLALRHQLGVLHRSVKRPKLTSADRLLWAWLCEVWTDWRSALVIVKPETVIAWHRKGFRLFWTWKIRRGQARHGQRSRKRSAN